MAEPRLEELSAYLDQELTGAARQELEAHLGECETCRRRLEALRQTVGAIQELPAEAPPRPFTIPAQREQPRRSAPWLGWLGGAAAAALLAVVVVAGLNNLHSPGAASSPTTLSQGGAALRSQGSPTGQPAPGAAFDFTQGARFANGAPTVVDPRAPSRRLQLATDSSSYVRGATIRVEVILAGSSVASADARAAGLQLSLQRYGAGTVLPAPSRLAASSGAPTYVGGYPVDGLSLPGGPGSYTLVATWTIPDGSGTILMAQLPLEIGG
jgi:putative zinc finger protein